MKKKEVKTVALSLELGCLMRAIVAAQRVLETGPEPYETEHQHSASVRAVLTLVTCRFDLVRRVLREEVDPEVLWGEHNASVTKDDAGDEDADIRISQWSRVDAIDHFEKSLASLQRRATEEDG